MRIAHFCDSHPGRPDGVTRSVETTVDLLRSAGHQVDLYRPGSVRSFPVPFRQVRVGLPFAARRADVVHVHTTGPIGMRGFRFAVEWGVPLVVTWHTDLLAYADLFPEIPLGAAWCAMRLGLGWSMPRYLELTRPGPVRRARLVQLGRAMFEQVTVVIAPSGKTAADLAEFHPRQIEILPTPVADAPPTTIPGNRPPTAVPSDVPPGAVLGDVSPAGGDVVLSVGRGTAEKNPELLLRSFALVRAARPGTRLVLLGVRQRRRYLIRRIAALGLTGSVDVLPPVPHHQVADHYRTAAVLAFTSTTDTQSLVLAEAEAAGLPVVVADPALATRPGTHRPPSGHPPPGPDPAPGSVTCPDGHLPPSGRPSAGPDPAPGSATRPGGHFQGLGLSAGLGPGSSLSGGADLVSAGRFTCEPEPGAVASALLRMLGDRALRAAVARDGLAAAAAYPPEVFLHRLSTIYDEAVKDRNRSEPGRTGDR
ncbi:glycosyltransferase [Actinoplanes couchii]|uniref:Glycosyl transferase, group 1 n=1 Tax=Actinoplanes couchii TaxID=403638 RepID=A0ABQ3X865_9ACTN|nr:glycosyltransferase [Actinoplanes couchii]MDR6320274.1 glycosyltransferase involved in cell wall biosynthesis [Actinoplanes couchii]GID54711.1 hypothetical protein Aco03nite_031150 [Actinoplanes couchii]